MRYIFKIITKNFFKYQCNHDFMVHGWTVVKCKKCGKKSRNKKIVQQTHNNWIDTRAEGMRKMGFSEEHIRKDNSHLTNYHL